MKKPSIHVQASTQDTVLQQILFGIEEEGIPFELHMDGGNNVVEMAYRSAVSSPLLVGLAYAQDEVVIHYRNLPADSPLFHENRMSAKDKNAIRLLGSHAARLVKGIPFKTN